MEGINILMALRRYFLVVWIFVFCSLFLVESVLARSMESMEPLSGHWQLLSKVSDDFKKSSKKPDYERSSIEGK
jgi:hypothetical protein